MSKFDYSKNWEELSSSQKMSFISSLHPSRKKSVMDAKLSWEEEQKSLLKTEEKPVN